MVQRDGAIRPSPAAHRRGGNGTNDSSLGGPIAIDNKACCMHLYALVTLTVDPSSLVQMIMLDWKPGVSP